MHIPQIAEYPRQAKRVDPIDAEHVVQGNGVVGQKHRPTFAGSPPQTAPPIRDLPVRKIHPDRGVEQLKAARRRDREHWWIRRQAINRADETERGRGQRWSRWSRLVLSSRVDYERPRGRPCRD